MEMPHIRMKLPHLRCVNCGTAHGEGKTFWHLSGYFGFSGQWCGDCYDLVAHDAYRQPKHPEEVLLLRIKHEVIKKQAQVTSV